MKVRIKGDITGLRDGVPWPRRGGELVVPDAEGAQLVAQGMAEVVAEPAKPERSVAKRAEKRA